MLEISPEELTLKIDARTSKWQSHERDASEHTLMGYFNWEILIWSPPRDMANLLVGRRTVFNVEECS